MVANLLLFYIAGLLQDLLWTLTIGAVSERKTYFAASLSFVNTVSGTIIFYRIFEQIDQDSGLLAILVYGLGVATGTIIGMEYKKMARFLRILRGRFSERKTSIRPRPLA